MRLTQLLSDSARYNAWANQTLVQWLAAKPTDHLSAEVASSYNSLLKTLNHIWAVEQFWLGVLTNSPMSPNSRYAVTHWDAGEILPGVVAQSEALRDYVAGLEDADMDEMITLDFPWVKGVESRAGLVHHVLNHSTYHRGQLTSIGRRLGYEDAPMTDFNFYKLVALVAAT